MKLPNDWSSFQEKAETLLQSKGVGEIQFSGSTYQILVGGEWAFLQIGETNEIKDAFCSCSEEHGCIHQATAFLRIFQNGKLPLHERYQRSFWREAIYCLAKRLNFSTTFLDKKREGHYLYTSLSGKRSFGVKGTSKYWKEKLHEMVEEREDESEENSLKFSNLTIDELEAWRLGRPSDLLLFELSFWGDFSKALFLDVEKGDSYKTSIQEGEEGLPNLFSIQFKGIELKIQLTENNLVRVIPRLNQLPISLKVHGSGNKNLTRYRYDLTRGVLLAYDEEKETEVPSGKKVGDWIYVSQDGFYPLQVGVSARGQISKNEISEFLTKNEEQIEIVGEKIHLSPLSLNYSLSFDSAYNLTVNAYHSVAGDLQHKECIDFGEWIYVPEKGFFRCNEKRFPELNFTVPKEEVGEFVSYHQGWLRGISQFGVHTVGIEGQLTFSIDEEKNLIFSSSHQTEETEEEVELGLYTYLPGQGFFQKRSPFEGLAVKEGTMVSAECVPMFIEMHEEELKLISGFFSKKCPIKKCGLNMRGTVRGGIQIEVEKEKLEGYEKIPLTRYENWIFVKGEGFSPLPLDPRLPEHYLEGAAIPKKEIDFFFEVDFELLRPFCFFIDSKLELPEELKLIVEKMEPDEKGRYQMHLSYVSSLGEVSIQSLVQEKKKGRRFVITNAGRFDLEDERFQWLSYISEEKEFSFLPMDILRINAYESMLAKEGDWSTSSLLKKIFDSVPPELPDLKKMSTELRPYQEVGLKWLWYLYHHKLGGLLCDDMGLGKTHQAMAFLEAIRSLQQEKKDEKVRFLVVCPTSVLYHWQDKLEEHLPHFKVCTYHGPERTIKEHDLLLTSYGVWRRDIEKLKDQKFEVAILDELQVAKNESSRLHGALKRMRANMMVGLTGTPVENRLMELKALFDLVLPGYFPGKKKFRENFANPIEKERSEARKSLLLRVIHPFVLRRKKEEVLPDLPRKIEEIAHCPLHDEQKELYQQVLQATRQKILPNLDNMNRPIPYMHIFAALTRLKQICDHPADYHQNPAAYQEHESGKWDLFKELLHEAIDSEQKVVVYSQYLAQLDIIQAYLKEQKIEFAALRGSTIKRGEEVRKFHENENCLVFVASLHAAGLGIDLTPASVVIHYDRWWNAAREDQATDRVHRIGQRRGIQVLKLMTKGTFEERIDTLIRRKAELMEEVIRSDEQDVIKQLDRDEILALFRDVELED